MTDNSHDRVEKNQDEENNTSKMREIFVVIGALAVGAVLLFGIYAYWNFERDHPATDNAYVQANYVWISPMVSGPLTKVAVTDNSFVKKGDLLFEIDTRSYDADLAAAQAALVLIHQEVTAGKAKVVAAQAAVAQQVVAVNTAKELADRNKPLVRDDVSPVVQGIELENSLAEARSKLEALKAALKVTQAEYGSEASIKAKIELATAKVELAQLNRDWTSVVAPADGYVTDFVLRVGDVVEAQSQLFPFVESGKWWVDANFKETGVHRIRPGQKVDITIDMYGGKKFSGTVESIGSSSAASFALLPPQNTTGNWVKVTQRIPVRIELEAENKDFRYRLGASAQVEVNTDPPSGGQ